MKKARRYIEVVFTVDFANQKAGDVKSYEPSLASNLVNRGIASIQTDEKKQPVAEMQPVIKKQTKKKKDEKNT